MKQRTKGLAVRMSIGCLTMALLMPFAQAAVTNGWLRDGGTYDYNDTNNWVGGVINGVWDSSVTLTQTEYATFASDTVLPTGLSFGYNGGFNLTLKGSGGDRVLTLGGDILMNAIASSRQVTIGSTAGTALNVNLGGVPRTLSVKTGRYLQLFNTISNGSFTATGGGTFDWRGAGDAGMDVTSDWATYLQYDNTPAGATGATRARNQTLRCGNLNVRGNSVSNSVDTVAGALVFDAATPGGVNTLYFDYGSSTGRNVQLSVGNLIRSHNAAAFVRGLNLGNTPGDNVANVFVTNAPTAQLVGGGGAAGSKNISILPWAVGSTNAADASGLGFLTYDGTSGLRPLNPTNECDNTIIDGDTTDHNVFLPPGTNLTLNGNCTINSLFLYTVSSTSNASVSGASLLTVTSGAVYARQAGTAAPYVTKGLDFGLREGVIGFGGAKFKVNNIYGSGGLTVHGSPTAGANQGLQFATSCNYTGNTVIIGTATLLGKVNVLPCGSRAGDVYVYGTLWLNGTNCTMNGLWGDGTFANGDAGALVFVLAVGDNNATSVFDGVIKETSTDRLALNKIGAGTLTLNGANTHTGPTTVSNGTLVVNGSLVSAVTVCTNAMLGGIGLIATNGATALTVNNGGLVSPGEPGGGVGTLSVTGDVHFAAGGKLALDVTASNADLLAVSGTVSADAPVLVSATAYGNGPWKVMTATNITADFTTDAGGLLLVKKVGSTELWLSRKPSGTVAVVR